MGQTKVKDQEEELVEDVRKTLEKSSSKALF